MTEVLYKNMESIINSKVLEELGLEKGKYILVSAHREEKIDNEKNFFSLISALNIIAETYELPIIYSIHPHFWNKIEEGDLNFIQ